MSTWYEQIHVPEPYDEAAEWAAMHEYELRRRRSELQRDGMTNVFAKTAVAMNKMALALAGDPSVPGMRAAVAQAMEDEKVKLVERKTKEIG